MTKKILLVEDDLTCIEKCNYFLTKNGYEVVKVESAEFAIHIMHHGNFDAVITDIVGANGLNILDEMRRENIDTPVIALSAFFDKDAMNQLLSYGAKACLSKPVNEVDLIDALEGCIATHV